MEENNRLQSGSGSNQIQNQPNSSDQTVVSESIEQNNIKLNENQNCKQIQSYSNLR